MTTTTVGHFLINDVLPEGYKLSGPVTNKGLQEHVVGLAKSDPEKYVHTIMALKRRGDEIATLEGVSVGLKDITPDYELRDAILKPALERLDKIKDEKEREKVVADTQGKLLDYTKNHKGSMTHMALSGARGNAAQLMKIVASPLATVNPKKGIDPFPIKHSYSEGLKPSEYWVTMPEVRANEVQARISVSEPGEMAKLLVSNMISTNVSAHDCNTTSGIMLSVDDGHILDRYSQAGHGLAKNTLITPQLVSGLKQRHVDSILVRSPMTCAAHTGVCQMCQGLDEKGKVHPIGRPVGVRAAQAMAEPLTQMALSARHGTLTVKETELDPVGLKGVRQLLEIPKTFRHEAVLAPKDGVVNKITKAPHGGHHIEFNKEKMYVSPELTVTAKEGEHFEAGDALTNGVPNPLKVVGHKGIGAGRAYFVNALHKVYNKEGINLDKRHLELLAKSEMNHVRLLEADSHHPELLKGDIISYNSFKDAYSKDVVKVPLTDALNYSIGAEVLNYTVGTRVTPAVIKDLKSKGVTEISINKRVPQVEFVMKPLAQNPMLHPDVFGRLAHRFLKANLEQATQMGETADIHGSHPVPAYAFGAELMHGPGGTY